MADPVAALDARFPGKRVVVTGAASGLGLELCRRFAAHGWTIGMLDLQAATLAQAEQAIAACGGTPHAAQVDVSDGATLSDAVAAFVAATGGVDVMVNNAGVAVGGDFADTPAEHWRWILGINVLGVVHGCQAALPAMRAAGAGILLNVASAAGFASAPGMSAYNASKAAVVSLSETLYGELFGTGIQVSVAMPYFFKTNLLDRLRASEAGRRDAELMMESTSYTLERAASDVLGGVARGRLYVLAPPRLRALWLLKRLAPMRYLRLVPRVRERRLADLRRSLEARSGVARTPPA
ncbi:MAG: SDR family NAD(P)-dependent oxidoreductase [Thermodesulfobacteriota bacterium]